MNAGGNAIGKLTNIDSIIDYKRKKYLAEHAEDTDDAIRLENSEVYRLPDGNRLVHLAFTVDPALTVYDFSLRAPRSDRPANPLDEHDRPVLRRGAVPSL